MTRAALALCLACIPWIALGDQTIDPDTLQVRKESQQSQSSALVLRLFREQAPLCPPWADVAVGVSGGTTVQLCIASRKDALKRR